MSWCKRKGISIHDHGCCGRGKKTANRNDHVFASHSTASKAPVFRIGCTSVAADGGGGLAIVAHHRSWIGATSRGVAHRVGPHHRSRSRGFGSWHPGDGIGHVRLSPAGTSGSHLRLVGDQPCISTCDAPWTPFRYRTRAHRTFFHRDFESYRSRPTYRSVSESIAHSSSPLLTTRSMPTQNHTPYRKLPTMWGMPHR